MSVGSSLDLIVDDVIVLHNSNRLTVRLLPCDVLARVARWRIRSHSSKSSLLNGSQNRGVLWRLLSLEWRQASTSVMASWSRCGPTTNLRHLQRSHQPDYATAFERLHVGMRKLDVPAPHFTDRADQAQQLVASRDHTPALA